MTKCIAACEPSLPMPEGRYVRTFEAEVDSRSESTIRVRGILSDHRCALEHDWVLQLPDYEILHASARHLFGDPTVLSPELIGRGSAIQGVRASQGFTQTMREVLGDLPGYHAHLVLAIEMARVGLQGYTVPKGDHERFRALVATMPAGPSRLARMAWERDRAVWPTLRNSCVTYRDESASLFDERRVVCFDLDTISPTPGQKRFFWRKKRMCIVKCQDDSGFHCQNEMVDSFHEMQIAFDIDVDGTMSHAMSQGVRLPFQGICEDAHLRTAGLNGRKLSKDFMRLVADQVGGTSGCSHLFDLSVDCLRFFTWR